MKLSNIKRKPLKSLKDEPFSKYIIQITTAVEEAERKTRKSKQKGLSPLIFKDHMLSTRHNPMKIFSKSNDKNVVQVSKRSIYKLANKFRDKSQKSFSIKTEDLDKNIFDIIKEAPSPIADIHSVFSLNSKGGDENEISKQPHTQSLRNRCVYWFKFYFRGFYDQKLNFNLDDSSSDSLNGSIDIAQLGDDLFSPERTTQSEKYNKNEEIKKAITKRVKNRELKLNNLSIGDDFAECLSETLKKDNNLQRMHLANNKISTRGAIAIFNKISNSWVFL